MVNKDNSIQREATIRGQRYLVTRTQSYKGGALECLDTIKNLTSGRVLTKSRKEWKKIFNKFN
jgi:hypothetical protein